MKDELTLMDMLKVLARWWKLVVAVALIPTVVVAGALVFAVAPTFTSTATLVVFQQSVVPQQDVAARDLVPLAALAAAQPVTTVATYVRMAQDPGLYQQVIQQLQLSGEPWRMTVSALARAVKVTSVKDTSIIAIEVKLGDKSQSAAVANAVADQLLERAEGLAVAERLSAYYAYVRPLLVDIEVQQIALAAKRDALAGVPKVLTTMKSIADDQVLLEVAKATSNQSVLDLAGLSMASQEVNPLWLSLTGDVTAVAADITTKMGLKALCERTIAQLESPSTGDDTQSPIRIDQRAIPADERDATGWSTTVPITFAGALLLGILLAFLVDYIQTARAKEAAVHGGKES
jgi:capsular polysaccharide biosynthesis protein